jgi:hypothetical protein
MKELPGTTPRKNIERAAREARLTKALRENLLRRKEQKRSQHQPAEGQSPATARDREPTA